jgi:hypothetical protein
MDNELLKMPLVARKYKLCVHRPDAEVIVAAFDDYEEAADAMQRLNLLESPDPGFGYYVSWKPD